jgi:uncharacterized protein involved in cysteine biosynthesis
MDESAAAGPETLLKTVTRSGHYSWKKLFYFILYILILLLIYNIIPSTKPRAGGAF